MTPSRRRFLSDCVWIIVLVLFFLLSSATAIINLTAAPPCEKPEPIRTVTFPTPQSYRVQDTPAPPTPPEATP